MGIKNLEMWNNALFAKTLRKIYIKKERLWINGFATHISILAVFGIGVGTRVHCECGGLLRELI